MSTSMMEETWRKSSGAEMASLGLALFDDELLGNSVPRKFFLAEAENPDGK